jgi:nitrogen fixation protein NifU and related proteins
METKHSAHLEEAATVIPSSRRFWQHARVPHNLGSCETPSASAIGVGSCGDKIKVELHIAGDILKEVKCAPQGCVYTQACASAMSVLATGCTIEQVLKIQPEDVANELEGLPEDHMHCARLAINTLGNAIAEYYRVYFAADSSKYSSPSEAGGKD